MPKFDWNPFSKGGMPTQIFNASKDVWTGSPEKRENVSTLREEQEPLYQQLVNAGLQKGAGGAFGNAADYYRNLLSNESEDIDSFMTPELRRYREQIIPDLAEQFATMGSGGLSSSGFQNAAVGAGTDLSERLGALRAQIRQRGAEGLANIGSQGLSSFSQNMVTQPGSQGLLSSLAPAIGTGIGMAVGGPAGAAIGGGAGNLFSSFGNTGASSQNQQNPNFVGQQTSPYGSRPIQVNQRSY